MRYIIKNCPALVSPLKDNPECGVIPFCPCKDIQACLMKQIVEKCKDMASDKDFYAYDFAKEILQLLEIEECEDE